MPFLQDTFNLVKGAIGWSNAPSPSHNLTNGAGVEPSAHYNTRTSEESPTAARIERCEQWLDQVERSKKRRTSSESESHARKRNRTGNSEDEELFGTNSAGWNGDSNKLEDMTPKKHRLDRELMPPPSVPVDRKMSSHKVKRLKRESLESVDAFSDARSQRTKLGGIDDDDGMEEARRRAAATQLPANSGTWEPDEQRLFFHLAYRGLEPLLPDTWMIDFPTLPLKLFATPDQEPLIQNHRSNEFRAIKALQDLIDTGKTVRDRALSPNKKLRKEPIIEKAANKYLKWTLKDIGVSSKTCIPIHTIVAMKKGQTTTDTIRDLTVKMHKLSARHRADCNVLTSIEKQETADENGEETRLSNDSLNSEHKLPVIYGLMICSSLLAVFTLSSHTPPPAFVMRAHNKHKKRENGHQELEQDENEDSGLRFIARFDFSDSASDVWNAFVIAIVAVMVRETLLDIYEIDPMEEKEGTGDDTYLNSSLIEDDEVDKGHNGYTPAKQGSGTQGTGRAGVKVDDDPDL